LSVLQKLIEQAKNPRGSIGSSMLCIMNTVHTRLTNWALQKTHIHKDAVILEIGCGGGKTIHTLSKMTPSGKVYGIDYSEKADLLYKSILIFQHVNCCYEEQKVPYIRFLPLFSLGMGQEKDLTASMHGWMLSPT